MRTRFFYCSLYWLLNYFHYTCPAGFVCMRPWKGGWPIAVGAKFRSGEKEGMCHVFSGFCLSLGKHRWNKQGQIMSNLVMLRGWKAKNEGMWLSAWYVALCGRAAVSQICWVLWPCSCQSDLLGFVAVQLSAWYVGLRGRAAVSLICWALWPCGCQAILYILSPPRYISIGEPSSALDDLKKRSYHTASSCALRYTWQLVFKPEAIGIVRNPQECALCAI